MRCLKKYGRGLFAAIGCTALLASSSAIAETNYPDRPIKLILGYAPGGGIDIIGRFLSQGLSQELGQPVVVENRAGASGSVAAGLLTRSAPDGYTLFMGESASLVAPALVKTPYDPVKDFEPVAQVGALVYGIAVNPEVPIKSMTELVEAVKKQPGKLSYGTPGVGNIVHLGAEDLKRNMNLDIVHVPYKGGGPMLVDLVAGQIPIGMTSMASLVSLEKAGRVRLVGVTSKDRSALFPDVQALSEIQPDMEAVSNIYVVAPAGTPAPVVNKLNAAINEFLKTDKAAEFFATQASLIRTGTPQELGQLIEKEVTQWGEVVREVGISQ